MDKCQDLSAVMFVKSKVYCCIFFFFFMEDDAGMGLSPSFGSHVGCFP
jgi:hypothetical protein